MKILVVTESGLALGLAQRLSLEGHSVDVYSDSMEFTSTGGRIYKISNNLWESVQACKFIISDSGNKPQLYKRAEKYNKPIIGCNYITDLMNVDSVKEYELLSRVGVSFPESELYSDVIGLAPVILEGRKKRYCIKYDRRVFTVTKPEWLAWAMYNMPNNKKILLQESVLGNDVSVIGWFNGLDWIKPFFYSTSKADKIGAVAMLSQKKSNRITKETIEPLTAVLKSIDYRGPVTANLIVNKTDTFVKNFYFGLTAPCVFAMIEGLKEMPLGDFLNSLAFGTNQEIDVSNDYLVGIEVANRNADMHGAPIIGIAPENINHIFLHGAYKDDEDLHKLSNETPAVYTAVAHGRDLTEAARRVYRTIGEVQFPDMAFITNLQGHASTTFNNLRGWSII